MKKILSTLFAISSFVAAYAQTDDTTLLIRKLYIPNVTTQQEYNYVTKGYQAQVINQGGDLKPGYLLVEAGSMMDNSRSVQIMQFIKKVNDSTNYVAAYMLVYKCSGNAYTEYLCIPRPDSDKSILQSYWSSLFNSATNYGADDRTKRLQFLLYAISLNTNGLVW